MSYNLPEGLSVADLPDGTDERTMPTLEDWMEGDLEAFNAAAAEAFGDEDPSSVITEALNRRYPDRNLANLTSVIDRLETKLDALIASECGWVKRFFEKQAERGD